MAKDNKRVTPEREQVKSLSPQNDALEDEQYYGDDIYKSTQIVTNYYYRPNNE